MCIRLYAAALILAAVPTKGTADPPPAAAYPPPGTYVYVPRSQREACFQWGEEVHIGTIDARGGFHLRQKVPRAEAFPPLGHGPRIPAPPLAFPRPAKVYEFHSGRLILGTMMPDGEFIPEAGSTVIKIEDYKYGQMPLIWNLPGYFKKVDPADAGKDGKK
jgi:hypothetical protein